MKKQQHTPSKGEQLAAAICGLAALFLFTGLLFFAITKG